MTNARLRRAFVGVTTFPPRAPFFWKRGEPSGSPHPSPAQASTEVAA
jgi:hypothetical protein